MGDVRFINPGNIGNSFNNGITLTSGQFLAPDGSAAAPSISFGTDSDLGFYRIGASSVGFSPNGSIGMTLNSSGLSVNQGGLQYSTTLKHAITAGITASTTHTQGQVPLTKSLNIVSTVAVLNDTVTLPSAVAGMDIMIVNNGINTLLVFPASGDDAGGGLNIGVTVGAGVNVRYLAIDTTTWEAF